MKTVQEQVLELLKNVLGGIPLPPHPFLREEVAAWDSLKHLEIIFVLEEEFGIRISAEQAADIRGSQDLVDLVEGSRHGA
jgi:acyl carrier protein